MRLYVYLDSAFKPFLITSFLHKYIYCGQPSFATDERRRIFDLFKERKRNRKKLLRKTSTVSSIVSGQSVDESGSATAVSAEPSGSGATVVAADAVAKPAAMSSGSQGWSRGRIKTADGSNNAVVANDPSAVAVDRDDGKKDENAAMGYDPGEGLGSPSTKSKKKAAKRGGKKNRESESKTRGSDDEENGNEAKSGLSSASTNTLSQGNNDAVQSERNEPKSDKDGPDDFNEQVLPLKPIVVPKADRPQPNVLDPSPSLSVPAAKAFIDLYYPHITSGLSDDLAMYYSPGAQKSVSIGGAHSVVTGRDNIQLQIASFVGSQFVVKSVVAQNTVSGGAFVLITGIVQTSPSAGSQVSSFAHSVNLVAATTHAGRGGDPEASFLIFNDALMLMKVSDPVPPLPQAPLGMESAPGMVAAFPRGPFSTNGPSQPQQQQQQQQQPLPQQQQQHHSPPPPGLLPPGFQF